MRVSVSASYILKLRSSYKASSSAGCDSQPGVNRASRCSMLQSSSLYDGSDPNNSAGAAVKSRCRYPIGRRSPEMLVFTGHDSDKRGVDPGAVRLQPSPQANANRSYLISLIGVRTEDTAQRFL